MIESPLLQEIITEERAQVLRKAILIFLSSRFGTEAGELGAELKAIDDEDRLTELIKWAMTCRSLKSFRKLLRP
jgi:hypothetical protein